MADLFEVTDLTGQPGAPFSAEITTSAGESIRRHCGWHIAPVQVDTIVLDSKGGRLLMLPSLFVRGVTAVRDLTGIEPRELTGWRWSANGMLERPGGWPCGFRAVEVEMTHGYDACPAELFPVAADVAMRRISAESIGGRSVSFDSSAASHLNGTLSAFKINGAP